MGSGTLSTANSFGRWKTTARMVTGGSGGALLANTSRGGAAIAGVESSFPREIPRARVREAAGLVAQWLLGRPGVYGLPASIPWLGLGETIYYSPPTPTRMSEFAAGVLAASWAAVAAEDEVRRQGGAWWSVELEGNAGVRTYAAPQAGRCGWLRFGRRLRVDSFSRMAANIGLAPGWFFEFFPVRLLVRGV